jgi:hypothetical protein
MKTQVSRLSFLATLSLLFVAGFAYAQPAIQYFRHYDQRGINVFETSKDDTTKFDGLKLRWGANFKQQYQNINHENSTPVVLPVPTPANGSQLVEMAGGFNLAMANLNMDVQLYDGVRVSLISYMSSRHHPEFWVKGGYFQIDKVKFLNSEFMDKLWTNLTLRVGHFEVNYGDQHFRRSDGGNGLYNPFVENYIMDAFTTEIGGELYFQKSGFLAMVGMTDGEIQGNVTRPNDRKPTLYLKAGYDKQINEDLRLRLTASMARTSSSIRNTLYAGDRTGSHYYMVMENTAASTSANFTSGRLNPNLTDNLQAIMINPFVKFGGFELFGTYEIAKGNTAIDNGETGLAARPDREFTQTAVDALYRFAKDKVYVGVRYNTVKGEQIIGQGGANQGTRADVSVNRTAIAAGWFLTRNVLFKAEYVTQEYKDFPTNTIFDKGKFDGFVLEGIIAF